MKDKGSRSKEWDFPRKCIINAFHVFPLSSFSHNLICRLRASRGVFNRVRVVDGEWSSLSPNYDITRLILLGFCLEFLLGGSVFCVAVNESESSEQSSSVPPFPSGTRRHFL